MNKSALGTILGVTLLSLCRKGGSSSFYTQDGYGEGFFVFPIQIKFKKPYYRDSNNSQYMVYGDLLRYIPVAIEMIQELWSRLIKLRPKCTQLHEEPYDAWGDGGLDEGRILQNQIIDVINKGLREIQVTNEFGTVKLYDSFVKDNRTNSRFVYFFTKILSQEDALCRILPFPEWESEITDSADGIISKETIISDFGSNKKEVPPKHLYLSWDRISDWEAQNICSTSWLDFKFKLDIPTHLFFLRQTEEQWKWYFLMILRTAMEFVLLEAHYYHQNEKIIMPSINVEQAPIGFIHPDIHNSVFSPDNPMKIRDR